MTKKLLFLVYFRLFAASIMMLGLAYVFAYQSSLSEKF